MAHPSETSDCPFCGFDGNRHTMVITEGWDEPQGGRIYYWMCQMCGHEATFTEQAAEMEKIAKFGFVDYTITNPLLTGGDTMPRKAKEAETPEPENQPGQPLKVENVYVTIVIKTPEREFTIFRQVKTDFEMLNVTREAWFEVFPGDIPF